MALNFPEWSDLGKKFVGEATQTTWDQMLSECEEARRYFEGEVFDETIGEATNDPDKPLLYPVGLNLIKILALAQTDAMFGEWDENIVTFGVKRDEEPTAADADAIALASQILDDSEAASMLWEIDLDRNVFGGGALKVEVSMDSPSKIKWKRLTRDQFYPVWNPADLNDLLEVYVVMSMTPEQAEQLYNYKSQTQKDFVQRIEHWTKLHYETYIDGELVSGYSGVNPWGIVPFVYIPRFRFINWYGESLTKDVISTQDELNGRVADIAEAINYNAHPTRWGKNLPRGFSSKNFPLAANAFWDLGRSMPNADPPEVGILEATAAVQPGVFDYVNFIIDWSRNAASSPPIAFGEDDGGGQRSGVTLEIRMWPLIKSVTRSRSYMSAGIVKALKISAFILKQKNFPGVPRRALESILEGRIRPKFAELLPRDQATLVDEVVKLLSTEPVGISIDTAQDILGRGPGEVKRIIAMLKNPDLWTNPQKDREMKLNEATVQAKTEADKKAAEGKATAEKGSA
jgi:hypothetical protein